MTEIRRKALQEGTDMNHSFSMQMPMRGMLYPAPLRV